MPAVVWASRHCARIWPHLLVKHTARHNEDPRPAHPHRVNVNTLAPEPATRLEMNEIVSVELLKPTPPCFSILLKQPHNGPVHLIDTVTNATVRRGDEFRKSVRRSIIGENE